MNYKTLRDSYYGLGCDTMYFGRHTPMFWRNVLLPTSGWNWTMLGKWPIRHKNEKRKLVMSQRNGVANQNYEWGKMRKEGSQHTLMGRLSPEMATTPSPCFTPICFTAFSFNNHYQFTPLLNSCPLVFCLMLFRWFISTYLSFF